MNLSIQVLFLERIYHGRRLLTILLLKAVKEWKCWAACGEKIDSSCSQRALYSLIVPIFDYACNKCDTDRLGRLQFNVDRPELSQCLTQVTVLCTF